MGVPADTIGTIVFAHANGFPAGVYRQLFDAWRAAGFGVLAPQRLGHDPAYPVVSNWTPTRDELLRFIDAQAPAGPLHLVGHSMGGYVCLLAACQRPRLAASVTLLDAPLVRGWRARAVQAMKLTGLMQRGGPGRVSRTRRQQWASRDEARVHFAGKRAFARWHPQVLDDYVEHGLVAAAEPAPDSAAGTAPPVRLAFDRAVETRLYNTLPHHFDALLRHHPPTCPVAYIGGTDSREGRQAGLAGTRALVHGRLQWIEGSHLFPMEQPAATAAAVLRAIGAATQTPSRAG